MNSQKPDKKCNLHWAFARPLKVLATLGNSFLQVGEDIQPLADGMGMTLKLEFVPESPAKG